MTFNEEIEDEIKEFVSRTENIYYFPDSNYGVEYLNNNFSVLGTKIDLSKENNYISCDFKKNDFLDMIKFFEFKKIIIKWRWGYGKFFISTQCSITNIFYNDIRFFIKKN